MIFILLIILIFLLAFNYIFCRKDIMAPPVLVCITFIFGSLCTLANSKYWGVSLSVETIIIIFFGVLFFSLGFITTIDSKTRSAKIKCTLPEGALVISNWKTIVVIIFGVVTTWLYLSEVRRMASAYGFSGGFAKMMAAYSAVTKYKTTLGADIQGLSSFVNLLYKFLTAIAYIYLYVVIKCLIYGEGKKRKRINLLYLIPIVEFIVCTICSASRLAILKLFAAGIILFFHMKSAKSNWKKINIFAYSKTIAIVFVVALLFSYTRGIVGRNNVLDPFRYITAYAGGSIELLDIYLKTPLKGDTLFGKESFSGIYSVLYRITGNPDYFYSVHKEFRTSATGISVGNVYTAFRPYYHDFGWVGIVLVPLIIGIIYGIFYKKMLYNKEKSAINMHFLVYSYFSAGFVFMFIDDLFCSTIIGLNTIIMLVFFYILRYFLVGVKRRHRRKM